ncbi:transporter substrate-binding domain-containing protein [Clostridium algoriphilum]|uniref:transporter substrate-binding domain-containing protein n=1 Tax=Clostridium algoriphilum TaxID=198347 RepID=UPI001CF4CFBE|nr:transporter substrate-binding domain-containing protein [Clostridium algoriphilum]MCB2294779.1 transporter substrate-binding domain-containing protein [Clostridium algoriphilum]
MKNSFKTLCIMISVVAVGGLVAGCSNTSGIKIGVVTGTTYGEKAKEYSKITEVKSYKDDNLNLQELANKRIDGVITDKLVALYGIKQANYKDLKLAGDLIYTETIAVAVRKDDNSLRQAINASIGTIIEDGTYAKISNKYFGKDILEGVKYEKTIAAAKDAPAKDSSLARVKKAGKITFALSGGYPPFNFISPDDKLTGFDVEIGKEVAKRLDVKYESVTTDWSGILEGLRSGRYDGIFGSMAVTPERLKVVNFTDPYYNSGAQLVVPKDSKIKSINDLK